MKIVVQVSGGIDSTVALAKAINEHGKENVYPISFNDGSVEWTVKNSLAVMLTMIKFQLNERIFICNIPQGDMLEYPTDKDFPDEGFVPGLKLFMNAASMAYAQKIGASQVWTGNMGDNVYPDESNEFNLGLQDLYNHTYHSHITIVHPFERMKRADVLTMGLDLGVNLAETVSCGNERVAGAYNCGVCDWCIKRKERFAEANIKDTTSYMYVKL